MYIESINTIVKGWNKLFPNINLQPLATLLKQDGRIIENETRAEIGRIAREISRNLDNNKISYSRNFFLPVSKLCINDCGYCNYKKVLEDANDEDILLSWNEIKRLANQSKQLGCIEALLCGGEQPDNFEEVQKRIINKGIQTGSIIDWCFHIAKRLLKLGLLPHTNIGVLHYDELKKLKSVNASMGLMLETSSTRLMEEGHVHEHSPGKHPNRRLEMIENAGKLKIPFTTGLLIGIGETLEETIADLTEIRKMQIKYDHIQEVIIQGVTNTHKHERKYDTIHFPDVVYLQFIVSLARVILPPTIKVQVPPNLIQTGDLLAFLHAGASDLGGISPTTDDHVNPGAPWPNITKLKTVLAKQGFTLEERLPVYERFLTPRGLYICSEILEIIQKIQDGKNT